MVDAKQGKVLHETNVKYSIVFCFSADCRSATTYL